MAKPKQILIGSHTVPVEYVKTLPDDSGQFMASPNPCIQINDRVKAGNLPSTIFHESLHALFYFHGCEFEKEANEEATVRVLETALPDMLKRNPWLKRGLGL